MEKKLKYNVRASIDCTICRTPSLVDDFYSEKIGVASDKKPIVRFIDPIYSLFNQQRLNKLGQDNIQQWLDSLSRAGHIEVDTLRSKCSDEQLCSMIKSRYLQSPSEILAWCKHVEENVDDFNAEVQAQLKAQPEQTNLDSNLQTTTE